MIKRAKVRAARKIHRTITARYLIAVSFSQRIAVRTFLKQKDFQSISRFLHFIRKIFDLFRYCRNRKRQKKKERFDRVRSPKITGEERMKERKLRVVKIYREERTAYGKVEEQRPTGRPRFLRGRGEARSAVGSPVRPWCGVLYDCLLNDEGTERRIALYRIRAHPRNASELSKNTIYDVSSREFSFPSLPPSIHLPHYAAPVPHAARDEPRRKIRVAWCVAS